MKCPIPSLLLFIWIGLFSILYTTNVVPLSIADQNNDRNELRFTVTIKNKTLPDALKILSQKSGYEISFNAGPENLEVNEVLKNVTLQEAINRMLRDYNHFEIWDDSNHKVTLFLFERNAPPVTITGGGFLFDQATRTISE